VNQLHYFFLSKVNPYKHLYYTIISYDVFSPEFHQLENNLHISQYLADTRETLHNMLRTGSISEDIMINLNIVTDCCYAWNVMESFIDVMQESIKGNPPTVIKLKALFLKVNTQTIKII